jgi:hypothetical protein
MLDHTLLDDENVIKVLAASLYSNTKNTLAMIQHYYLKLMRSSGCVINTPINDASLSAKAFFSNDSSAA